MKTKFQVLICACLLGLTANLSANLSTQVQTPPLKTSTTTTQTKATPQERAQKLTDHMAKELVLTSDQQTKVQAINLKYAEQRAAYYTKNKTGDVDKKQAKVDPKKSFEAQDAEFKAVLTAEQYKKYLANKESAMKKIESKMEDVK